MKWFKPQPIDLGTYSQFCFQLEELLEFFFFVHSSLTFWLLFCINLIRIYQNFFRQISQISSGDTLKADIHLHQCYLCKHNKAKIFYELTKSKQDSSSVRIKSAQDKYSIPSIWDTLADLSLSSQQPTSLLIYFAKIF